jgi:hypothetical protein
MHPTADARLALGVAADCALAQLLLSEPADELTK